MKRTIKIISLLLCFTLLFSLCACNSEGVLLQLNAPSNNGFWEEYEAPDINFSEIGGSDSNEDIHDSLDGEETVYDLVYENVSYTLANVGFTTKNAMAINYDNDEGSSAIGIMYYNSDIPIFADESYQGTGFYEILSETEATTHLESVNTLYVKNLETQNDTTTYLAAYDYQDIGYDHFVYNNKYVIYYQESDNVIRYLEMENLKENYDLSLGSLFDFDNGQYIYDASIFGEYTEHSGSSLINEQDYSKLKEELQKIAEAQLAAGYRVEEYNIVYISPENIQAYLESEEEDTFFGYNVDELTQTLGLGTALNYTENGFEKSTIIESYNWKEFLAKVGVGCGIILVGAILTPVTGGTSFGCALLTITKVAAGMAISSGLGTLAIETAVGLIEGKSVEDAIKSASHKGLDAFANGFMIGAVIGSVGVVSGLIKPTACFVEGTPVATLGCNNQVTYLPIESVAVGTTVYSYNENTKEVSLNTVTDIFSKQVYETVELFINGEIIETTYEHPFYLPMYSGWMQAGDLKVGDAVLTIDNQMAFVESITVTKHREPITVYNFTVENDHTYYVGEGSVLVHNACDMFKNARNSAGKTAKADALDDIVAGRNYKKWGLNPSNADDLEIIKYVQANNKFPPNCEFAHAVDVKLIKQAYSDGKITMAQAKSFMSNPNNGMLTNSNTHYLKIHMGDYNNTSNISVILKARPSIRPTVEMILGAIA